jgi:glycine hydroxymethyltransferase
MLGWINLQEEDPEVCNAMRQEAKRQRNKLELIASENYTSRAVLETPFRDRPPLRSSH